MTAPLTALTEAARRLRVKDYDVSVSAKSNDEVGELAGAFDTMASEIREHTKNLETLVKSRTEQLDRTLADLWSEMDLALKIQTVLLPPDAKLGEWDIAAKMIPASNVGGDYYDFFPAGSSEWVLIGDVSGHGISAGLIMMMTQTAVRTTVLGNSVQAPELSPSRVLATVNRSVRSNLEKIGRDQYMTISALRLDGARVHYAGLHQDILVYRVKTGVVESITTSGIWIGVLDDIGTLLEDASFTVDPGDVILLFTDGITEMKAGAARLGVDALKQMLKEVISVGASSRAVVDGLFAQLATASFQDDATMMAICKRRPTHNQAS
jgi:serine phosphatase RsbU (regulator of sigma subunit)